MSRFRLGLCSLLSVAVLATGCGARPDAPASPGSTAAVGPTLLIGTDQISHDDPHLPVHIAWPVLSDGTALAAAIRSWAEGQDQQFHADYQPADDAPPELDVAWELLPGSGPLAGIRLSRYEFAGANGASSSTTFYGDRASGRTWRGGDLIAADQRRAAVDAVLGALRAGGHEPLATTDEALAATGFLDGVGFARGGDLNVWVPQGSVLPSSDGELLVTVPAAQARGWLVPNAQRLADAAAAPDAAVPSAGPASTAPGTPSAPSAPGTSAAPSTSAPAQPSATAATSGAGSAPDCSVLKCVALTFDDGPGPYTDQILDTLTAAHVRATFFELGQSATAYPAVVRRQNSLGMVIGTHTVDHKQLTALGAEAQRQEVDGGADQIAAAGVPRPQWLRPPYGSYNATTQSLGWPIVLWNVDSEDWKNRNAQTTTANIMREVQSGSIVLMHDIHPSTAQALPGIIQQLQTQGYTLVTVPELVGAPVAGQVYFGR